MKIIYQDKNLEIYRGKRIKGGLLLEEGLYENVRYFIFTIGTHPTAYVKKIKGIEESDIDCHGGVTYNGNIADYKGKEVNVFGWDYAHYGDYFLYDIRSGKSENGVEYDLDCIRKHCMKAIKSMKKTKKIKG